MVRPLVSHFSFNGLKGHKMADHFIRRDKDTQEARNGKLPQNPSWYGWHWDFTAGAWLPPIARFLRNEGVSPSLSTVRNIIRGQKAV
jgi:hypothetical protein